MQKFFIPVWERLALNNLVSSEYEKAEKYFMRIFRADPDRPGVRHNMGLVKLALKNFGEAEAFFREDLKLYGPSRVRLKCLGDLYYLWGKRKEAGSFYSRALSEDAGEGGERLLEARVARCADPVLFERSRESLAAYEEGVELLDRKQYDPAAAAFERAVGADETNFQALNNLGVIYLNHRNDRETAAAYFRKAADLSAIPVVAGNLKLTEEKR